MIRVLILDDDESYARQLADYLIRQKDPGFSVIAVAAATQAIEAVKKAVQPFDVFLIDHLLGTGADGIQVMRELRKQSPESETIIFTGFETDGMAAFEAGAYRYLEKPIKHRELVWILRQLYQHRSTQYERDWLRVLTQVTEEAQRALSVHQVAEIITRGGVRLGFERSRLWMLSLDQKMLLGKTQVGAHGIDNFSESRMPISESPYAQRALQTREPSFFHGDEFGPNYLDRKFRHQGFLGPMGEWVYVPLWSGDRCLGAVVLDNAIQARELRPSQRTLVRLFGNQSAAALERAELFETQQRHGQQIETLRQISLRLTSTLELKPVLESILKDTLDLVPARDAHIFFYDGIHLTFAAALWADGNQNRQHKEPRKNGITYTVAKSGERKIVCDVDADPFYQSWKWGGAIVSLPLRVGNLVRGVMNIAFAKPQAFDAEDLRFFDSLADHAAVALQNARLYEQVEVLNEIGQRVTARAASENLDVLLPEVRTQIGRLMDVHNFSVALVDEEADRLDFRFLIEKNRIRRRHWRLRAAGLEGRVLAGNHSLLLTHQVQQYCDEHAIILTGHCPRSWLGVPLRIASKPEGVIIACSYEHENVYTREDERLLSAIADQIAGAIHATRAAERERQSAEQLAMLHRIGTELVRLAEENEDWLWRTTLTAATAHYALGFNRALLFLSEDGGRRLVGRAGVGHSARGSAQRDWRKDQRARLNFDGFLERLRAGRLKQMPIDSNVRECKLDLSQDSGVLSQALENGQIAIVPAAQAPERFPKKFIRQFGVTDYAIVPIYSGGIVEGVVAVDNVHDHKPIRVDSLNHFATLLTQAWLTLDNHRQRQAREQLLDLNYTILAEVSNRSLRETLRLVCKAAKTLMGADLVAAYSVRPNVEPYQYDHDSSVWLGNQSQNPLRDKPRQKGLTAHILRSGILVVPDTTIHGRRYGEQKLDEHPFFQCEQIRAFIGIPIKDIISEEPFGVLYVDYRTPQTFSHQDRRQVEFFAGLAAVAMRTAREVQGARAGRDKAEAQSLIQQRELTVLRDVLTDALTTDNVDTADSEERLARTVLNAAHKLVGVPDSRISLFLRDWQRTDAQNDNAGEIWRRFDRNEDGSLAKVFEITTTQMIRRPKALVQSHDTDHASTHSIFDVPPKSGSMRMGFFTITNPRITNFTLARQTTMERLAAVTALALDNAHRQEHLRTVLDVAKAVLAPVSLNDTLQAIEDASRRAAPGLSALTIWHKEPESDKIVLGPRFGINDESAMTTQPPGSESRVWKVMNNPDAIWATDAIAEPKLIGRFVRDEHIKSAVAFPLRAERDVVGAMFFNYRQRHVFTSEEMALLPIFAEIAALSIRDATVLEATRKQTERLEKQTERLDAALGITEAVGTTLDLGETLRKVMRRVSELFPKAKPCVLTYNQEDHALEFRSESMDFYPIDNPDYYGLKQVKVNGTSIASRVARHSLETQKEEHENIPDISVPKDYLALNSKTRSEFCISLMSGGRLLGILALESEELAAFDDDDVKMAHGVAQQISMALERAQQSADLRLNSAVAARTAWAAELAHEINGEIGNIRTTAYKLSQKSHLSEHDHLLIKDIDESADRLRKAFRDTIPEDSVEEEGFGLDVAVSDLVQKILRNHSGDIDIRLELDLDDFVAHVHRPKFENIVGHYVRNAHEAMKGKGVLTVRTRLVEGNRAEIEIEDTGPGIPGHLHPRVFQEPFSTKPGDNRGYGLLYVCLSARNMGGTVSWRPPEENYGTRFRFRIPVSQNKPMEAQNGTR